jgi:hypothetical protein
MVKRLNPRIEGWGIVYRGEYRRVFKFNYYKPVGGIKF